MQTKPNDSLVKEGEFFIENPNGLNFLFITQRTVQIDPRNLNESENFKLIKVNFEFHVKTVRLTNRILNSDHHSIRNLSGDPFRVILRRLSSYFHNPLPAILFERSSSILFAGVNLSTCK